jgi:CBS domain-containing protein
MEVREIMTREVQTCRPDDRLSETARRMWEQDCGCMVVVDRGGNLAGILTDRDALMGLFFENARPDELTVDHVMSRQVVVCRDADELVHVLELMSSFEVRRLPVIGSDGRLEGIVSLNDVVRSSARDGDPAPEDFVEAMAQICTPRAQEYVCVVAETGAVRESVRQDEFVAQR